MYDIDTILDMLNELYNDTETQETMNTNCVLELSPGGNELFGRAWNKETELEEDGENK